MRNFFIGIIERLGFIHVTSFQKMVRQEFSCYAAEIIRELIEKEYKLLDVRNLKDYVISTVNDLVILQYKKILEKEG